MIKLNLGAGAHPLAGYNNIDAKNKTGTVDATIYPLAHVDGSVDEVRASHVLEHFPHGQVAAVVKDWVRALKPGGVLKIAVPDLRYIAEQYLAGEQVNVQGYLMGGQTDALDYHKCAFDRDVLTRLLTGCGLVGIRDWTSEIEDCARLPVSLNLAGTKPGSTELKISAVCSLPRLGFNDFWGVMYDHCLKRKIPFRRMSGAFWGIKLTQAINIALEKDDPDYILALDYDTVFTGHQLDGLIDLATRYPDADAIAPLQASRHHALALLTVAAQGEGMEGKNRAGLRREELDGELLKLRTAHFGCTLLKASTIRKMPKPWFNEVPDENGEWGDGSIHEDIWFWKQWEKAGFSLYSALRVPVGHCDLAIRWPDLNLETTYQAPRDFLKSGPPDDVWR